MNVKKNRLMCYTGVIDKEVLYTYNNPLSLIMKYNLKDFSYEIMGQLQSHVMNPDPVIRMLMIGENIYLVMFRRRCIVRFNIADRSINEYSFSERILAPNELMWAAFMYKNCIWEFSVCTGCKIYIFNCHTEEIEEYCSIKELFEKKNLLVGAEHYFSNMFQIDNEVWAAICGTTYIFCFNLDQMDITVYSIDCEGINSFDYDGNEFWITVSGTSKIINWSPDRGMLNCFNVNELNFRDHTSCYICSTDDRVFVIPNSDKDFCSINRKTKEYKFLSFVGNYQKICLDKDVYPIVHPFGGYIITLHTLILLPRNIDKIVVIDLKNEIVTYMDGALKKEDFEKLYIEDKLWKGGIEETWDYKLTDYIENLERDTFSLNRKKISADIGKVILNKVQGMDYE